jgi:predicted Zn-dependent peptidase
MKITTFKNGVRAVVVPLKGIRAVTVEVQVKIGAKYERKPEAGLSHFLEHMAFKGTETRSGATEIFREMDIKGANFEAETGYETTSFNITTTTENRDWALEMLSDILFNSKFPEEEIVKERGVIAEEIKMYQDNPMMGLSSEVVKWLWGSSEIGCWNISGELTDIKEVDREKLVGYHQNLFNTGEMVVVIAGRVTEDDMGLLEKYFGNRKVKGQELPKVKIKWNSDIKMAKTRPVEQGHLGVIVPTFGSLDRKKYALRLLNIILTGNTSSRLFEEVRSKRGWAYYVYPIGENINEDGFWGVQVGVPTEKLEAVEDVIKKEILTISNDLEIEEMERAKTYLQGKVELMLDKSDFWSGFVGNKILSGGKLVSPKEELTKLKEVKWKEVKELANELFRNDKIRSLVISK